MEASANPRTKRSGVDRFLDVIERVGNRLPDQASIFVGLAVLTLFISWIASSAGVSVIHPTKNEPIHVVNLLSHDGLQWIFASVVRNFVNFAPLGTVLVAMIGIGVAERAGLFAALLKALVMVVPRVLVTPTIVFAGVMSNVASDAGYVILPPLAAMLYASLGRHPLAGVAAAFAGVAGGFSANLLLSTLDPMLAGLTQEGARIIAPNYTVNPACNYYFLAASTFVLTIVGWGVSAWVVEPRLGAWTGGGNKADVEFAVLKPEERRGLAVSGIVFFATIGAIVWMSWTPDSILRDPTKTDIDGFRPLFDSLVGLLMLVFILPGLAYGWWTRQIRSDRDAAKMMTHTMSAMGGYIVMAFFAAQFIEWFKKSNLGLVLALEGAAALKSINLTGIPLMIAFVALTAMINLLISSASAKWAMLAPIFVPLFMQLGKSPEAVQAFYRVGDSVTNIITPLNIYFPILLAVVHRYVPTAGMGTLIAAMVPYSIAFFAFWSAMVAVWVGLGWSLGPGAPLEYAP